MSSKILYDITSVDFGVFFLRLLAIYCLFQSWAHLATKLDRFCHVYRPQTPLKWRSKCANINTAHISLYEDFKSGENDRKWNVSPDPFLAWCKVASLVIANICKSNEDWGLKERVIAVKEALHIIIISLMHLFLKGYTSYYILCNCL